MITTSEERRTRSLVHAVRHLLQQSLRAITRPGSQTMSEEMWRASWGLVGLQLIIYGFGAVILDILFRSGDIVRDIQLNGLRIDSFFPNQPLGLFVSLFLLPFISTVILAGVARLLGGQGSFLKFLYANLLFLLPLMLIWFIFQATHLSWLSDLSNVIVFYILLLRFFALRAVYNFSQGRAFVTVLILIAISIPLLWMYSYLLF